MTAKPPRYQFERVPGDPGLEALQDRLGPLFEQFSTDHSSTQDSIGGIDTTTYKPGDPSKWASPPPKTLSEALDRIAASLGAPP